LLRASLSKRSLKRSAETLKATSEAALPSFAVALERLYVRRLIHGKRILILERDQPTAPAKIVVVVNWLSELK
jgi:hypothetical protein